MGEGKAMDFGIALATESDSWKVVQRAEELGFTHAWFYDTQMLSADCFVAMGAAAVNTKRIRLGTGVLVPSNRIAPVTANALASLNSLAPGRIDFGVGTGFTARRAMGFGAIKLKAMETYIDQIYALLNGEIVEFEMEGERRKIRFLNPELGAINTRDPIALHLSAMGPRTREIAAERGAGWINFMLDVEAASKDVAAMRSVWDAAGRAGDDLSATVFALGCVLEDGERADSERAIAQAGPCVAVGLHIAADAANSDISMGARADRRQVQGVNSYAALAQTFEPADAPYLHNHRGHLIFVKPEERPFLTAEAISGGSMTGTHVEICERIAALRDAGYTQFTVQLVHGHEDAINDWARIRQAFA
jgi:5,10-methylenetetrahydromethanopterin reductase